jgi:Protein of unknown function (DUF2842)
VVLAKNCATQSTNRDSKEFGMSQRMRKLVGTIALLLLIIVYALVIMVLAAAVLPYANKWLYPVFYAVAGVAWVPLAGPIVAWMHGGRRDELET